MRLFWVFRTGWIYAWISWFTVLLAPAQILVDTAAHKQHLLILPLVARSIETDWSFGVAGSLTFRFNRNDTTTRTSNLQALALYSVRSQFVAVLNGAIYFPGERYILNQQLSYSSFPDKFWGLGTVAPDGNEEAYRFKQYYIFLHLQRLLSRRYFIGVIYEYQRLLEVNYQTGGLFDQQDVKGRTPYRISGMGSSFTYDSRNNAFVPNRGGFYQLYFNHFAPLFGSDYRYTNYVVDLRRFERVGQRGVLALQAYGFFNSGNVPLRSLASFGGANSMRGYYDGRFRDKDQFVVQAEYRQPLFWRLGAVAFASVGYVGHQVSDFTSGLPKYGYGVGVRLNVNRKEGLNLRVDYGIGQGTNHGLYFQLGEAF